MTPSDPLRLRWTFDAAAERYDRVRPGYPPELFADMAEVAALEHGSRVLEIGCGTGQATVPMADRGYQVTALELGPRMAAIASGRLAPNHHAEIIVANFDDWRLPADSFDAVVSANAFHWLDPRRRVAKALASLRVGGCLVVIDTRHSPVCGATQLAALRACYPRWDPDHQPRLEPPKTDDHAEAHDGIDRSPLVDEVVSRRYSAEVTYSTDDYLDLLMTYSHVLGLEPTRQSGLLTCIRGVVHDALGGHVVERYVHHMLIARRSGPDASLSA